MGASFISRNSLTFIPLLAYFPLLMSFCYLIPTPFSLSPSILLLSLSLHSNQKVIAEPMDLETIRNKVDAHMYPTLRTFLRDLNLIQTNAEEFNPRSLVRHGRYGGGGSSSSSGAYASAGAYKNASDLSHAAHSMMDTVHSMVYRLKVMLLQTQTPKQRQFFYYTMRVCALSMLTNIFDGV